MKQDQKKLALSQQTIGNLTRIGKVGVPTHIPTCVCGPCTCPPPR